MNKLLNFLLLRVLSPSVDDDIDPDPADDDVDPDPVDDDVDPDPVDDDVDPDPVDDDVDPQPAPKISRAAKEIHRLREEKQAAHDQLAKANAELEAARRGSQPQGKTHEQQLREQEDAVLSDPNSDQWQKYAVLSARDAREAKNLAQQTLRDAHDIKDQAEFNAIAATQPKTVERYKDRVESMLKELRAKGQNAPRKQLLALVVGQDLIEGKLKSSSAKPAAKPGGVARGKTPGVRSDVSGNAGGRSEAEKRAKRLENVII